MSTFPYGMNGGSSSAYSYDHTGASQLMGAANYLGLTANYLGANYLGNAASSSSNPASTTAAAAAAVNASNHVPTTPTDTTNRLSLGWAQDNN